MKIGIIGNGFVGKATFLLKCDELDILAYDVNPELCNPPGTSLNDLNECEIIFISVPTPMNPDGSCHLNIIQNVLNDLESIKFKNFVVIRSTIPVGTSDSLKCHFMPEFLTEKNYVDDFINNKEWYFGLLNYEQDYNFKNTIIDLFNIAFKYGKIKYNNIIFTNNREAEMIKLFRNCFLATKVSFCNEIAQYCHTVDVDYETVRKYATNDNRILDSHTKVPGPDGKRGFGGTCFPKDISSLKYEMENSGVKSYILTAAIERNENVDRKEKDWEKNIGRSVTQ